MLEVLGESPFGFSFSWVVCWYLFFPHTRTERGRLDVGRLGDFRVQGASWLGLEFLVVRPVHRLFVGFEGTALGFEWIICDPWLAPMLEIWSIYILG